MIDLTPKERDLLITLIDRTSEEFGAYSDEDETFDQMQVIRTKLI